MPVLVLHGGLSFIEDMSCQIRALAASHFVAAVDAQTGNAKFAAARNRMLDAIFCTETEGNSVILGEILGGFYG
jgi:hypothetical protein